MIKYSWYHFCSRQIYILVIWCKCTELSPAGLYLWEQWLQVLLLLALLWTLFALLQHFSFNQTSQGTWRKSCPVSVVPILSKYSPSQTFAFTWELQAAVCCTGPECSRHFFDPIFGCFKGFLCWKKGYKRILGEQRDAEAKEQTARFFGSLNFLISGRGFVPSWGPSQCQAVIQNLCVPET